MQKLLVNSRFCTLNIVWLVVSTPLKNMQARLDHHPNSWGKKSNVPNHQPGVHCFNHLEKYESQWEGLSHM